MHAAQRKSGAGIDRFYLAVRDGRTHHAHVPLIGE
jgi:hypothetical protein